MSIEKICRPLGITRMGLYKKQKAQIKQITEAEVIIKAVHKIREEQPRIGVRKLQILLAEELRRHSIKIGRDGLFDLFREFGLLIKTKRYKHYVTNSHHQFYKHPNRIKNLSVMAPGRLWVSDITYIEVAQKYQYLFLITDAYSRKIVGHCLSSSYSVRGAVKALSIAVKSNKITPGLIHHSDRGVQYCCKEYTSLLQKRKAAISMTENSDPYENAIAERVNGILKTELLRKKYDSEEQSIEAINKAINIYNKKRPHLSIGLLTPEQAHKKHGLIKQLWKKKQYPNKKESILNKPNIVNLF